MNRNFRLLLLLLISFPAYSSITVLESSSSRLLIEFETGDWRIGLYSRGSRQYSKIDFPSSNRGELTETGYRLPSEAFYAGLPGSDKPDIIITPVEIEKKELKYPLWSDSSISPGDENVTVTREDGWISRPVNMRFRGLNTVRLIIQPFKYEESSNYVTILKKARVEIVFGRQERETYLRNVPFDDYQRMLKRMLLNYSEAKNWIKSPSAGLSKISGIEYIPPDEDMFYFNIGDGHSGIKEYSTEENGAVKIKAGDLKELFRDAVNPGSISLSASRKNEIQEIVPHPDSITSGIETIPMFFIDKDGDGRLDDEDYYIAYVSGNSDWFYDPAHNKFEFVENRYSEKRRYWLRGNGEGAAMAFFNQPDSSAAVDVKTYFINRKIYKNAMRIPKNASGGSTWIWALLDDAGETFSYTFSFENPVSELEALYKIYTVNNSRDISVSWNNVPVSSEMEKWLTLPDFKDSKLEITFGENAGTHFELKAVEFAYPQHLSMEGLDELEFFSDSAGSIIKYRITDLPQSRCFLFRIPQNESAISLVDTISSDSDTYEWADTGGAGIKYHIMAESTLETIDTLVQYTGGYSSVYVKRNLRSASNKADYMIITKGDFLSLAVNLAEHKKNTGRFTNPVVVDVEDIYRSFSGGNSDPGAIRNFLVYALNNWSDSPLYLLLFGNGHYDFKGFSTYEENIIPAYQYGDKCYEDFYSYLDAGESPADIGSTSDIFVGRLPVNNESEAEAMIDKIIAYEGVSADYSAWRNRVLLIADDDMQGDKRDQISPGHYESSEDVENEILKKDENIDIRKVYLFEYPWTQTHEKPDAAEALKNEINNGVGIVNFFGHGDADVWADEGILRNENLGSLNNRDKYPIVTSFSCNVGRFDKPSHACLSGELARKREAGSIVSVSSTRTAYAGNNTSLAKQFFRWMCDISNPMSVGQSLVSAKKNELNSNQKGYSVLGDPSIMLAKVTDSVGIRIIVDSEEKDTLKALQAVTVNAAVYRDGEINSGFGKSSCSSFIDIRLLNPTRDSVTRKDGGTYTNPVYSLPGTPVFSGVLSMVNGKAAQEIYLPRRLTYDKPGAKLIAYAWYIDSFSNVNIGKGLKDNIVFSGTGDTDIDDTTGPRISVSTQYDEEKWNSGAVFTDRISTEIPFNLEIFLYDESGIDVTGNGPNEGLTFEVEGIMKKENINEKFQFTKGDYRRGRASIELDDNRLKEGDYTIVLSAQDLLGNYSSCSIVLEVVGGEDFRLGHVFNYPNPVRMGQSTKFYFTHSDKDAIEGGGDYYNSGVDIDIKIYTLSGRLIEVIEEAANGCEWDIRDNHGRPLSPNVYLYRVIARVNSGSEKKVYKSKITKLVISPPK